MDYGRAVLVAEAFVKVPEDLSEPLTSLALTHPLLLIVDGLGAFTATKPTVVGYV